MVGMMTNFTMNSTGSLWPEETCSRQLMRPIVDDDEYL